jgi:hypothetical protein
VLNKSILRFRNIPSGEPFTRNSTSGDYSLQLMIGFHNYQSWLASTRGPFTGLLARTRIAVGLDDQLGGIDKREGIRQGPHMRYEDVD